MQNLETDCQFQVVYLNSVSQYQNFLFKVPNF